MAMHGETDFEGLPHWRLRWRKDSEYRGKPYFTSRTALTVTAKSRHRDVMFYRWCALTRAA